MDFFVRKESDSELLTGTKIYVSRKKYGDMSGNIHILQGYVCMITALNSIDNYSFAKRAGNLHIVKTWQINCTILRPNGTSLNVLGKHFVVQYVTCLILVVNLSQSIGLFTCIMECPQANEGGCSQILHETCRLLPENVN